MNVLEVWTDGAIDVHSKLKPGGWSSVYVYNRMLMCTQWDGERDTTSQRMEMTGALMGLKAILDERHEELKGLQYEELRIVSDSAYLVNAFNQLWYVEWMYNGWKTSTTHEDVKNQDLWRQLISYKSQIEEKGIKLVWKKVKGHSGLMYNELADKLAVKGKLKAKNG